MMCRTGMCRFGIGNWIFLIASAHLFTYVQGAEELVPDEGVRLTAEPHDAVVEEGDAIVLACAAARGARVHWRHRADGPPRRDDVISSEDKYRKQLANGSLAIESMSATLAGHYQCVATGSAGSVVSRVALLYLAEVPPLLPGPRSILGTVGAPALLPCGVSSPPRVAVRLQGPAALPERKVYSAARLHSPPPVLKLNVTWLKNGSPVRLEAARVSVTPSGALELDPLRPHDAATYRCRVALSPHKHRTGEEIELLVSTEPADEEPPRFVATPQPITVIEGASVTFDCAAVGNPKPEITWLNNVGVAIDLNDLDSRFYLVGSGSLRVQAARGLDAGSYTCRAHSRLDSADSATTLTVLTAPRVSLPGGSVVVARTRGDVTLRCDVRGRGATVSWLKDGEPLTPNQHDIALVDGSSLRIQGVLRVDAGMFQCAASSAAGSAVAALRLVVLPPDDELASLPSPPDIFNSLVPDSPDAPDSDFLGETSSAFTHPPDYYDYTLTEGLELGRENATIVSPPRELRAVIVKHRFVTLSWLEPARKLEEVVGYVVVYRVKGSERERVSRGSATRFEMNVATLQPNTTYVFSARALTLSAISPPTESIEAHTAPEELSFGPPTNVKVEATGPHSLRVKWSPPAQEPQPPHYTVHYTEVETGREQVVTADAEADGSGAVTLGGLRAAAAYAVAVAGAGGAAADAVLARTLALAPLAPPVNVSAEPASPTSILVRWEAPPARTHRGPLTGYKVRFRAAGARRKADSLTTPADARRAELRDLDPHTTYQIRVCAINANGSGPFSEWLTAATQARAQDESRVPPQPPPLSTRAGRDWISVWWEEGSEAGSLIRGYRLGWGLGVPDVHGKDLPAATHHHVIRGLESNEEYVISLHASNALGAGPPVYATVRTKAAAEGDDLEEDEEDEEEEDEEERPPLIPPVGLKVIMLSGSTAVVYWTDPTLPKGQTATDGRRYVVRYAAAGAGQRARSFNATDLNCMLDDLKPFTLYEFAVKLIKGGQESAWSMLVSNTTLEAAPASAPRDLRASAAAPAARVVDLVWTPPAKPNGVITGYTIMYAPAGAGAGDWTVQKVEGDRPRARVERLRARTTYSFKVQAKNSKGVGPFCAPISYTTGIDTGGGGLAGATSAWLWASAGGACAVLALAAALALSLCCRKAPPLSPHTSTYQKSSASAGIKPPDLWIHHDQMELKHLDKSLHSSASKISAGSVDGPSALASSTLTLTRAPAEYEPARHPPPASLDRRHYVPTYVDRRSPSCAGSDETAPLRSSPAPRSCNVCAYRPMTGMGVGVGVGAGCAGGTCERRAMRPPLGLPHPEQQECFQSTPLLAGVAPLSPQSSLASLHAHAHPGHAHNTLPHTHSLAHPPPAPCGGGTCPLGAACAPLGGTTPAGSDIYACAARERGHYVAYEPLGHYTHRDSMSSDAGGLSGTGASGASGASGSLSGTGGSLQRRACAGPLHSFADSPHSTPSHGQGSVRETSPYKKSNSSSPGHIPNRLQLGGSVPHCPSELEALTPSRSTERLAREMQNLEGLMKDLSAITQQQFHC
ncbi:netrin receptor DCC [Leguminivora glycinivorella]|uniref:netrin receptor DCC n=1 Tax=Leguminivora glycinivorella TaxID=1035111 RepID=UPI002010A1EC|nr:netrin receptor DCC [Leguminivora glycinivorella]